MARGGKRRGAGRPTGSLNQMTLARHAALADAVDAHIETAISALAEIAKHGQSEAARVSASVAILDRAYGRPRQASEAPASDDSRPDVIYIRGYIPQSSET